VRDAAAALAASPHGASLSLEFVPIPPWMPASERTWRAVEGAPEPDETTYLLLEAVEPKDVIQAGLNASGFLSWLYLAGDYAQGRGSDQLSRVIHPGPRAASAGSATSSGTSRAPPTSSASRSRDHLAAGGTADRIVLRRK
jgi:hypothetical protein